MHKYTSRQRIAKNDKRIYHFASKSLPSAKTASTGGGPLLELYG